MEATSKKYGALAMGLVAAATAASCARRWPEGVYPCAMDRDCPPAWICRTSGLCYSQPEPDGGPRADAGTDAATDAPMRDTGPTCGPETCNGTDDDCDGLIDEGVMTVGPAVVATTSTLHDGARMVGTADGYLAVIGESADPSPLSAIALDGDGAAGTSVPLGPDVTREYYAPSAVTAIGTRTVVVTSTTDSAAILFLLDSATGARIPGASVTIPTPAGLTESSMHRLGRISPTEASVYTLYVTSTGGGVIRRAVVSLTGTPTITSDEDILTDAGPYNGWAVLPAIEGDLVLYERTSDCRLMMVPNSGSTARYVVRIADDCGYYAAMALRHPDQPISALNPLGIAWTNLDEPLRFLEVSSTTNPILAPATVLPDSNGPYRNIAPRHMVSVVAVHDGPAAGHWLVANIDQATGVDPHTAFATVQVREIIGSGAVVNRLTVPFESGALRTEIDLAQGPNGIRLIERANDMGLVTRAIGCE